ncbi:hypothetical protein HMPREF1990_01741 [Porphyromonas gingivalis W4087]|nr:hypothetical protein HMPREF1990_01741 [Porphyromonas gingivalis W4087]
MCCFHYWSPLQKEKAIKKYLFGIVFTRRACRTSHRGAEVFISITTQKNSQLTMKSPGKCRATVSHLSV